MAHELKLEYDYETEGRFNSNDEGFYLYFKRTKDKEDVLIAKVPKGDFRRY